MSTDQPSSAPDAIGDDARDPDTPAAVLHDDAPDQPANPLTQGSSTGAAPNSPIDTGVAPPDEDGAAEVEARAEAVQDGAADPIPRAP